MVIRRAWIVQQLDTHIPVQHIGGSGITSPGKCCTQWRNACDKRRGQAQQPTSYDVCHHCHDQLQRQDQTENCSHVVREVERASERASGVIRTVKAALGCSQKGDGDDR